MRDCMYGNLRNGSKPPKSREISEAEQFERNELISILIRGGSIKIKDEYTRRTLHLKNCLDVVRESGLSLNEVEDMDSEKFDTIISLINERAVQAKLKPNT